MINGTLLNRVLTAITAITKASDRDMVTVTLSDNELTITSGLLSVSMPMDEQQHVTDITFDLNCAQFKQVIKGIKRVTLDLSDDRTMLLIGDTTRTIGSIVISDAVTTFPKSFGNVHDYGYLTNSIRLRRSWALACSTISVPGRRYSADDGLCTMLIEHDATDIRLVSTDGYRLTVASGFTEADPTLSKSLENVNETKTLYLPYHSSLAVNELLTLNSQNVLTAITINRVNGVDYMQIDSGDITITVMGITVNRFPQYRQVIPRDGLVSTITFSDSILQPIKRLWDNRSVLTDGKKGILRKQDVKLSFELIKAKSVTSTIRITSRWNNQEISPALDATSFLRFELGDNACFILDYTYLVTMLEAMKDVRMNYRDSLKALTFHDTQGNMTLIMPMQ